MEADPDLVLCDADRVDLALSLVPPHAVVAFSLDAFGKGLTGLPDAHGGPAFATLAGLAFYAASDPIDLRAMAPQAQTVHRPGGFQETVWVPVDHCHPTGALTAEAAALCETLSVSHRAIERTAVGPGERVLVLGAGIAWQLFGTQLVSKALVPTVQFKAQPEQPKTAYANPAMWYSRPGAGDQDPSLWVPT